LFLKQSSAKNNITIVVYSGKKKTKNQKQTKNPNGFRKNNSGILRGDFAKRARSFQKSGRI